MSETDKDIENTRPSASAIEGTNVDEVLETDKGIENSHSPTTTTEGTNDIVAVKDQDVEQQQIHEKKEQPNESSPQIPIRSGFLSFIVIIPPVADSKDYDRRLKWLLTVIVALAALAAPMGSNILLRKLLDHFTFSTAYIHIVSNERISGAFPHL